MNHANRHLARPAALRNLSELERVMVKNAEHVGSSGMSAECDSSTSERKNAQARKRTEKLIADGLAMQQRFARFVTVPTRHGEPRVYANAPKQEKVIDDNIALISKKLDAIIAQLPTGISDEDALREVEWRVGDLAWEYLLSDDFNESKDHFTLGRHEFENVVWTKGYPSLEDRAREAIRCRSAKAQLGRAHEVEGSKSLPRFSNRETEYFSLFVGGLESKTIADRMKLDDTTVSKLKRRVCEKIDACHPELREMSPEVKIMEYALLAKS